MTIKELKNLLQSAKGKIIVVEDEKPIMVITPYEEENLERQRGPSFAKASEGELTLDDLPL
jgi:hypothetical protein